MVDIGGGRGDIQIYVCTELESQVLTGQDGQFRSRKGPEYETVVEHLNG